MRQTLRQIVAVLALGGIAMSLVPQALAATYTDLSAANKLATAGIIVDKSANPADYRLGDTLTRAEATKVAGKGMGVVVEPVKSEGCTSRFSDVLPGTWECAIIEIAAKTGLTKVEAGKAFRPSVSLNKYEAMAFAFRSSCTEVPAGTGVPEMAKIAAEAGIIANAASWNGTAAATRGEFFRYVATAMEDSSCDIPEDEEALCTLMPELCEDVDTPDEETPSTGDVEVELSDETPAGRTLPKGANGVVVAAYDITAGSEDALVSGLKLSREGLSVDADVENFAVLVDGVRVTDAKDENSDDEVTLTFKNGGVAVDAGETVTIQVVIDTTSGAETGAEIAVALVEVTTGGDVDGLPVTGETFKIGSVSAPKLEVLTDGSVTDPQLGETAADLFRFKVKNTSDSNDTVSLEAITFEQTGGIDETSELANYELLKGSEVLATVESTNSKYVTFVLDKPLAITQGNNVSLKVVADVVGGAGETIEFGIDQKLDVVASTTRYGNGVAVTIPAVAFDDVIVEAGTIALAKVDASVTKVREDKDDIVLGTFKVTAAQSGLEMKKIGFSIKTTNSGVVTLGDDDNVDGDCNDVGDTLASATGPYTLSAGNCTATPVTTDLLDDVQLRDTKTGARYDLTAGTAGATREYYDSSIDFTLPEGVTTFEVLADTDTSIHGFDKVDFVLSINAGDKVVGGASTDGGLLIQETGDDTDVEDITPSSLTWKKVEGSESGATFSVLPMADITKVRGANDVIAMQFEIEADESSSVTVDEVKAYVEANAGAATSQMVSQVALYKGSTVNESNLLDTVSGSNLAAGVATFDGFDVEIDADAKQTFTVTLSFVDGVDASNGANNPYTVKITAASSISATDDENDDLTIGGTFPGVSPRDITVTDKGTVTLSQDTNNVDNKDPKTILAGQSAKVFSVDVQAQNEPVDVEEVVFSVDTDVTGSVKNASLYLGDTLIATNTASDIAAGTITFKNLSTLVLPQEQKELVLQFNTDTIGFEKNGSTETGVNITNVALNDMTGSNSGIDLVDQNLPITTSSKDVAIVPVKVTASVASALTSSSSQAKLTLTVEKGDNTVDANNTAPTALLTNLIFTELGNAEDDPTAEYKIYKEGNAGLFGTINCTTGTCVFAAGTMTSTELTITTSSTYVIVPTGTVDKTYSPVLGKAGVVYNVAGVAASTGLTSNAPSDLELGSRTY